MIIIDFCASYPPMRLFACICRGSLVLSALSEYNICANPTYQWIVNSIYSKFKLTATHQAFTIAEIRWIEGWYMTHFKQPTANFPSCLPQSLPNHHFFESTWPTPSSSNLFFLHAPNQLQLFSFALVASLHQYFSVISSHIYLYVALVYII